MKNDDLRRFVDQPDTPDLDDATRERIVSAAVVRYRHAERRSAATSQRSIGDWLGLALKPAIAVAAGVLVVIVLQNAGPPSSNGIDTASLISDDYNGAVFEEYRSLFQHELRAVVARNGEVDVVLGGQATGQTNPIVFIRVEIDGKPVYITAYSGQTIEAEIGGKKVRMDILTTSDQDVVVASDEFMFERGVLHGPDNFSADAHVLETRL